MTDFEDDIVHCLEVLRNGGLLLYPTDTIWGLGCDATNAEAVLKIYQLKKRPEEKSLVILMAGQKDIFKYITQPNPAVPDYLKTTTKPTTVIYEGATGLAENAVNKDGTVAIRITADTFCSQLIKRFKRPLVSTSANISGDVAPAVFDAIKPQIKSGVDYIVKHRRDDLRVVEPSSIIKFNRDGSVHIIRP